MCVWVYEGVHRHSCPKILYLMGAMCVWVHAPGLCMPLRLYFVVWMWCVYGSQIQLSLFFKGLRIVLLMQCVILPTWSHRECALPFQQYCFYLEDSENKTRVFKYWRPILQSYHLCCYFPVLIPANFERVKVDRQKYKHMLVKTLGGPEPEAMN